MMRKLSALWREEDGSSVIELAAAMSMFTTMVVGMVDLSTAYSTKLQLEQAAQRAVEKVQQYQTTSSTFSTMKAEAASAAGISVTTTNPTIDWWLECNGVRSASYTTPCAAGQIESRWVTVRITKTYTPYFASRRWPGANSDGTFTLVGEAGIRTQ